MLTNTISVTACLVNGTEFQFLSRAPTEVALAEYLCPDVYPKVQTLVIDVITNEGKKVTLNISQERINVLLEDERNNVERRSN